LDRSLKGAQSSISVPEIVATDSGELVVEDRGYIWCLTRNLPGFHPDVAAPEMYLPLTEGLARFHHALRLFCERQQMHAPDGVCVRARQSIERFSPKTFVAFTSFPHEIEVLQQATAWLLPRLDRFELLPRQMVHGDWTPRNVLFDLAAQPMGLTAVLDFEAMSWDPVHMDLANTCSTLLMWSGLDRIDERIANVLDTYERSTGLHLEQEDIRTAMLAHWLCHYWNWRDRLQHGEFGRKCRNDSACESLRYFHTYRKEQQARSRGKRQAHAGIVPRLFFQKPRTYLPTEVQVYPRRSPS
jgi:Ser/Thr protein kinase RdoA (MazF antagonist)